MQFTNNKFILTLVISNVIAFTVIFALIWMLWNNNATINNKNSLTADTPLIKEKMVTLVESIVQEVKDNNLKLNELVDTTVPDPQTLSDREYLKAYKKLKIPKKSTVSFTEKDATTIKVANKKYNSFEKNNNYFNKVDVSQLKRNPAENRTLAHQVSSIVSDKVNKEDDIQKHNPAWKDYLETLKDEGAERRNEMRTIKVKRGETLWKISIRAYGTGFKYKKIFKANPHLTSPHSITAGEILRVPL